LDHVFGERSGAKDAQRKPERGARMPPIGLGERWLVEAPNGDDELGVADALEVFRSRFPCSAHQGLLDGVRTTVPTTPTLCGLL